jgi:hypothetical protein
MLVEAAGFFAAHDVIIQRVLTDNAKAYAESVLLLRRPLASASS